MGFRTAGGKRRSRVEKCIAALLGLLLALVLFEVALRVIGGSYVWSQQRDRAQRLEQRGEVTVLCVGESTTALGGPDSWPAQLETVLNEGSQGVRYTVLNEGVPGADSSVLLARMDHQLATYAPDLVVAMMGANDNHQGYGGGAIPADEVPQVEERGILRSLKTYEFLELALFTLGGEGAHGTTLEQVRRWHTDGLCAAHTRGEADERACRRHIPKAWALTAAGHNRRAERRFLKGVRAEDDSGVVRAEYALFLAYLGRREEADAAFVDAIALDPENEGIAEEFGGMLLDSGRAGEAADQFRRAREISSWSVAALHGMGRSLAMEGRCQEAIPLLEDAVRLDPDRPMGLEMLSRCHAISGNEREALATMLAAVDRSGAGDWFDMPLWHVTEMLEEQGRHDQIRALFEDALEQRPLDASLAARVGSYYQRTGDANRAARYRERAAELSREYVCPLTSESYARLRELAEARGIGLVAVQYPRRPVAGVEALFPDPEGVVFVDNQESFEQAIAREGYHAVFVDRGYGDFGHASRRGNRLLAENVGAAILERYGEVFDARVAR